MLALQGNRSIVLALGGGGVKCLAHLGVLQTALRVGLAIRGIAATSGAALVAALFAAGHTPERIRDLLAGLDAHALSRRRSGEGPALFGLSRWKALFTEWFHGRTFEDLALPIGFPVVDLATRQPAALHSGSLVDALLAAVAIPGIFPPQQVDGRWLVDGGVMDPVPVALARSLAPGLPAVAVPLMPPIDQWNEQTFPHLIESVPLLRRLSGIRLARALGAYVQAADLTNRSLAELRLQVEKPDVIIRPAVNHIGLFDRVDVDALILAGETAARAAFGEPHA